MCRRCRRCNSEITMSYLLSNKKIDEIICPNCGRVLIATKISKLLALSFFIVIFSILLILPLKIFSIILIEIAWSIFSYRFLPIMLFDYEERE